MQIIGIHIPKKGKINLVFFTMNVIIVMNIHYKCQECKKNEMKNE